MSHNNKQANLGQILCQSEASPALSLDQDCKFRSLQNALSSITNRQSQLPLQHAQLPSGSVYLGWDLGWDMGVYRLLLHRF